MNFMDTAGPPRERADAYRQALLRHFSDLGSGVDIWVDSRELQQFDASLEWIRIGDLHGGIHRCSAPHRVRLPPAVRSGFDFYLLCEGDLSIDCQNGSVELSPGDMFVRRAGAEWQTTSNHFELIGFGLPEVLVGYRVEELQSIIDRLICGDSALAACVGALVRQAAGRHKDFLSEEGFALQRAIVDAICMLGVSGSCSDAASFSAESETKIERLQTLALRELECADLSPATLAQRAGISTRTVHRIFAASGTTFRDWVRERRLERCWQELTNDQKRRRTIADVAFDCGFNDLSNFNRSFQARFGMTPSAARSEQHKI